MDPFQVLADSSRRQVVARLRRGECQVNDIVEDLAIHQSGVSRHLRILLEAGFVNVRPEGQLRLYSLKAEPFREMEAWLADYLTLWEGRLKQFDVALAARKADRVRTLRRRQSR